MQWGLQGWISLTVQADQRKNKNIFKLSIDRLGIGNCLGSRQKQGCALAEPSGPWCPPFAIGQLENNLSFFI